MKVLHVITGLAAGGAETQLELVLQHTRYPAEVATLYNFGSVGQQIVAKGTKAYNLGMHSNRQISSVFRLAKLMQRGRYDVVHVHLYRACIYGRVAAWLARVPVVVTTEHSIGDEYLEGRRKTWAVRLLYLATERLSSVTIAVSAKARERLVSWGVPEEKIRVIPNGLDFGRFTFNPEARSALRSEFGIPSKGFVIGSVGRLHPLKRYDLLIKAAVPLLESGGWLLLVGEGQEKLRLQHLARKAAVDHRTIFAGERVDIPQLLSTMDVFVSASEEETFGLATLEAVAAGLPVIVAECPALDGLQVVGVQRVFVDALQLRQALLDERGRKHRSDKPDEAIRRRYDIQTVAAIIDDLYEALLAGCYKSSSISSVRGL